MEKYNTEIVQKKFSKSPFKEQIKHTHYLVDDKIIGLPVFGNNNSEGIGKLGVPAYNILTNKDLEEYKVEIIWKIEPSKNSKQSIMLNIFSKLDRISFYSSFEKTNLDNWKDGTFEFSATKKTIKMFSNSSKSGNIKSLTSQDFNFFPILVLWGKKNKWIIYMEDFTNIRRNSSQDGMSVAAKTIMNDLIESSVVNVFQVNNDTNTPGVPLPVPVSIPRLAVNSNCLHLKGDVERDNEHERIVKTKYNQIIETIQDYKNNKWLLEMEKLRIDLLHFDGKKFFIYEAKGFKSNTYYEAIGQLLTYRERILRSFSNATRKNVVLILLLNSESNNFSVDFESVLKEEKIVVENISTAK